MSHFTPNSAAPIPSVATAADPLLLHTNFDDPREHRFLTDVTTGPRSLRLSQVPEVSLERDQVAMVSPPPLSVKGRDDGCTEAFPTHEQLDPIENGSRRLSLAGPKIVETNDEWSWVREVMVHRFVHRREQIGSDDNPVLGFWRWLVSQ